MPAVRLSRRRRSSLSLSAFNPAKAGYYGIQSPSPRPVTFAPNVTPVTYVEPEIIPSTSTTPSPDSLTSKLFPPSEYPPPAPTRRRVPPGKRRSMGYIPRPPNAFMLFRADFVRQKHVPGSIETNHGSLSKIIGNCWKSLPLEEKRIWEVKAKHAKAEHKARYPEYRFRPVHNKNKDKKKDKAVITPEDESRCEAVAQFLLEGKKGDELAAAVRNLDRFASDSPLPPTSYHLQHRRSSSVPLPNDWNPIAIPALPFYSRGSSGNGLSLATRSILGQRRASSANQVGSRMWRHPMPMPSVLQRDHSPLPEVDTSLFEQSFLDASSNFSFPTAHPDHQPPFDFQGFMSSLPPNAHVPLNLGPLESIHSHSVPYDVAPHTVPGLDWLPVDQTHSDPSSTYSGSPSPSDQSLPVHAPQPQHPDVSYDVWKEMTSAYPDHHQHHHQHHQETDLSTLGLDFSQSSCGSDLSQAVDQHNYATGLESIFDTSYTMNPGTHDMNLGFDMTMPEMTHHHHHTY